MAKKTKTTNGKLMEKMAYMLSDAEIDSLVKISGTEFDAKRRFTDEEVEEIKQLYADGVNVNRIRKDFNCAWTTIKCIVDEDFRSYFYKNRTQYKYSSPSATAIHNRINKKRNLIAKNKVSFVGVI